MKNFKNGLEEFLNTLKKSIDSYAQKGQKFFNEKILKKEQEDDSEKSLSEETGTFSKNISGEEEIEDNLEDRGTETQVDDPVVLAKKKKEKIIRIGLVLILAFLAVDTFFSGSEEENVVAKKEEPTKKKKSLSKKIIETHDAQKEATSLRNKYDEAIQSELNKKNEEFRPQVNSIEAKLKIEREEVKKRVKEVLSKPLKVEEKKKEEPKVVEQSEKSIAQKEVSPINKVASTTQKILEMAKKEDNPSMLEMAEMEEVEGSDSESDEAEESAEFLTKSNGPTIFEAKEVMEKNDFEDKTEKIEIASENMKKIIEKMDEAAKKERRLERPRLPEYRIKGRGLVYNCKDKYWACVTKEDYLRCDEVYKWEKESSVEPSCQVSAVYESNEDCYVMQIHFINTVESEKYCN